MRAKRVLWLYEWKIPANNWWGFYRGRPVSQRCLKCAVQFEDLYDFIRNIPNRVNTPHETLCKKCFRRILRRRNILPKTAWDDLYIPQRKHIARIARIYPKSTKLWDTPYADK